MARYPTATVIPISENETIPHPPSWLAPITVSVRTLLKPFYRLSRSMSVAKLCWFKNKNTILILTKATKMASYSHTKIHMTHRKITAFSKQKYLPVSSGPRANSGHILPTQVLFSNVFVNKVLFECSCACLKGYFSDPMW